MSTCKRSDDLVSILYGEANPDEAHDFEKHLRLCEECRSEMASFAQVRESIGLWKAEALGSVFSPRVKAEAKRKSAVAAVREFFALSPMWMKGAVAFALILFFVLIGLTLTNLRKQQSSVASNTKFTQDQVDQMIKKALEDQAITLTAAKEKKEKPGTVETTVTHKHRPGTRINQSNAFAKWRRPLSRTEREQLAADLRLLSTREEDSLDLLGDRINKEF